MSESPTVLTRFLLGELPEAEQAALEERYFNDPRLFEQMVDAEYALVDDYARNRLSADARSRFEQYFLAHPRRRERAAFAQALVRRLDSPGGPSAAGAVPSPAVASAWRSWLDALGGPTPALGFALALLVIVSGVWFVAESRRMRDEVARAEAARAERESQAARAGAGAGTPGPEPAAPPGPGQPEQAASIVTFALAVGPGVRAPAAVSPPTLEIPPGTDEIRLELSLAEREYSTYRVILRAVGGAEIWRRDDLKPQATPGPAFILALPPDRFPSGDYMLTLQGKRRGVEYEDLSQSLFRVERR